MVNACNFTNLRLGGFKFSSPLPHAQWANWVKPVLDLWLQLLHLGGSPNFLDFAALILYVTVLTTFRPTTCCPENEWSYKFEHHSWSWLL
jgi:hypothetical protein